MGILNRLLVLGTLSASNVLLAQHGSGGGAHSGFAGSHFSGGAPTATVPYHLPSPTSVGRPPLAGTFSNSYSGYGQYPATSNSVGTARLSPYGPYRQGSSYGRRGRYRSYGFVGVPFFGYGYGGYPYGDDFGPYGYSPDQYSDGGQPMPPLDNGPNDVGVGQQLQQLNNEVNDLRNNLNQANQNPPVPYADPQPTAQPTPPITVVLSNGQSLQVQNYAVMGDTFWDFSSQPVRKIPVSAIDVSASTKATEASGAEFPNIRPRS